MNKIKGEKNAISKVDATDGSFTILTDEILEVLTDSTEAYTFRIETPTDSLSTFENFIIEKIVGGEYLFYIYRYVKNTEDSEIEYNVFRQLVDADQINIGDFQDYLNKQVYDAASGCLYDYEILVAEDGVTTVEIMHTLWCEGSSGGTTGGGTIGGGTIGVGVDPSGVGVGSGGGSSSSANNNTSGNQIPHSTIGILTSFENLILVPECNKINNLFINNPTLQQELISLKGLTGASTERGKYKLNSTTLIQNLPVGVNGEVGMSIPSGTQKYEMIAHTHNAPASATYSVFSFADFRAIYDLLRLGKIDTSKFTAFLMTADGTNYAFTINNPTQFLKIFASNNDSGFDSNVSLNAYKMKQKYYDGIKNPSADPLIIENSTGNLKDEKLFLDFLKNINMGVSLFEVNDSFDTFEMVRHNQTTDSIIKQNCN